MENIVEYIPEGFGENWPDDLRADVDKINPYPCQTCKKEFRSCEGLRNHHCWECKECTKVYRTNPELQTHECIPVQNKKLGKGPRGRYGRKAFANG